MYNLDDEQIKDQIEHELDIYQFMDCLGISFRELIDLVFDAGVNEEQRGAFERAVR